MSRLIAIVVGMFLLWALFEFGARSSAPTIQQDVQLRTADAVAAAGYDGVSVIVDGRDVQLTGDVRDEHSVSQVAGIASDVRGVRIVDNNVAIALPYVTKFCKDESTITLTGNVPSDDAKDAFPERARDMFRAWSVSQKLDIRDGSPDGFRRFMDAALIELGQLDEGCITLTDTNLLIMGDIRSERAVQGIRERIAAHSDLGFETMFELNLPVLSDQALACQEEANKRVATGETVLFSFDSAEIHEIGRRLLDEVVEISKSCPNVAVYVTGHTDAVGDIDYNIDLSERRAEAVVNYMIGKGVNADRLTPFALGFSQPVANNSTEEGRAMNRRIEFRAREE
jgi:OOP family OmpA-OmpF porin